MNRIHELKCTCRYFQEVWDGTKLYEIRKDDRDFEIGDRLILHEYYTLWRQYRGRNIHCLVTSKLDNAEGFGLMEGYCILGISVERRVDARPQDAEGEPQPGMPADDSDMPDIAGIPDVAVSSDMSIGQIWSEIEGRIGPCANIVLSGSSNGAGWYQCTVSGEAGHIAADIQKGMTPWAAIALALSTIRAGDKAAEKAKAKASKVEPGKPEGNTCVSCGTPCAGRVCRDCAGAQVQ